MNTLHQLILDNMSTATLLLDKSLQIQFVNPAAEMLLQASSKRVLNKSIDQFLAFPEADLHKIQQALQDSAPFSKRQCRLINTQAKEILVDYCINTLENFGLLLEIHPRDHLIRIEREEEIRSRQESLNSLLRGLGHEIKNPLGGIRGAAQLLERQLDQDDLKDYTQVIIDESDRLRNLVDRILGPHGVLHKKATNIHNIIEKVWRIISLETQQWIDIQRDYDPSLPEFEGDQELLIQAIMNIMRNAVQALTESENPAPCIQIKTRALRQLTLGNKRFRLLCSIDIIDNGPGIPEDIFPALFLPLVTSRAQGTGLGLSIAQTIINKHDGLIECLRTSDHKTCFQILLPLEKHDESF